MTHHVKTAARADHQAAVGDGKSADGSLLPDTPAEIKFPLVISEWRRNAREVIRVSLDRYQDHPVIDVRTWFEASDGKWRPSRSGITISTRHLHHLANAMTRAKIKALKLGICPME